MPIRKNPPQTSRSVNGQWLGKYPGITLHRIGTAIGGFWIAGSILKIFWPIPDQITNFGSNLNINTSNIVNLKAPVHLFVVGISDSGEQVQGSSYEEVLSLILMKVDSQKPLKILQLPTELGVKLPGFEKARSLSFAFREGGISLFADVISEILELPKGARKRYIIFTPKSLSKLLAEVGEININQNSTFKSRANTKDLADKNYKTLSPNQAIKFTFYNVENRDFIKQRWHRELLMHGIYRKLASQKNYKSLPRVTKLVLKEVQTDLAYDELMAISSAAIGSNKNPIITQLPLAPRSGNSTLRQLASSNEKWMWSKNN